MFRVLLNHAFYQPPAAPAWRRYLAALLVVAAALVAREALTPFLGRNALPYIFLFPAVAAAAWLGGLGPAFVAVICSTVAASLLYLSPPASIPQPPPSQTLAAAAFILASLIIIAAVQAMHHARGVAVAQLAERLRAEEDLRKSEAKFSTIFHHSPVALALSTPEDGTVLEVNSAWLESTGLTRDQIIGRKSTEFNLWLDPSRRQAVLDDFKRHGRVLNVEVPIQTPRGEKRVLLANLHTIEVAGQKLILSANLDVTERKKAEEILARGKEELEQLVAERTASLREALAQMEEFTYSVSHDLRAPARAMRGFAQALLEDYGSTLNPEARDYLDRIAASAERMDALMRDILAYSRIGRLDTKFERLHLDSFVRDLLQQAPDFASSLSHITVVGPLPDVLAHPASLGQAISNLVNNALKFVPDGKTPEVRIRAEQQERHVRLWVEDNGIGVAPEHQHNLFNLFTRLHSESVYEGTGVGLAIVRKAVERMGGKVGVESDGKNGSRFWLSIPAAPNHFPPPA